MPVRTGRRPASAPFFRALPERVSKALPPPLRSVQHQRVHGVMKFHFGHPETHFEAWHHSGRARVEVGLHFEGRPELNQAALDFFRARILEVKDGLPRAELEPWDRGWARLYETIPAHGGLDERALDETAGLLAAYMTHLQPLLERFWRERDGSA